MNTKGCFKWTISHKTIQVHHYTCRPGKYVTHMAVLQDTLKWISPTPNLEERKGYKMIYNASY